MKFETINNQLCRMVEPEPLTPEATFPCVVRLIQDDSPMGRYNQSYSEYRYGVRLGCCMLPIVATHIAKNGVINNVEWDVNRYEIIGYPVVEGSIEWAWYQRCMLDIPVIGPNGVKPNNNFTIKQWCDQYSLTSMKTGWQLYEPQPEPATFANVKVGDWVEHNSGGHHPVSKLDKSGFAIDGYEFEWFGYDGYELPDGRIRDSRILRIVPKPEVKVKVTLEGTVRKSQLNGCFVLDTPMPGNDVHTIRLVELDPNTAELVKALLKAQRECWNRKNPLKAQEEK